MLHSNKLYAYARTLHLYNY